MAKHSESRNLKTAAEVMAALGGPTGVSRLTGAQYKNAWAWQRVPIFPARYFLVMTRALRKKRFRAPPSLWGQVTTADMENAA